MDVVGRRLWVPPRDRLNLTLHSLYRFSSQFEPSSSYRIACAWSQAQDTGYVGSDRIFTYIQLCISSTAKRVYLHCYSGRMEGIVQQKNRHMGRGHYLGKKTSPLPSLHILKPNSKCPSAVPHITNPIFSSVHSSSSPTCRPLLCRPTKEQVGDKQRQYN